MCTWPGWGWIDVEIRRVLLNKTFLAVLVALVALNCFFFIYQQSDGQGDFREYGNAYHQRLSAFSDLSWEEGLAQCAAVEEEILLHRRLIDHDLNALCLDALHYALNGGLTEIV